MKKNTITALHLPPHERPKAVQLTNTLEGLQKAVGGMIEFVYLPDGFMLLLNEEGKLIGLEPNRRYEQDVLVGDVYVVKDDGEGELTSLSEEEIEQFSAMFFEPDEDINEDEVAASCGFFILPW